MFGSAYSSALRVLGRNPVQDTGHVSSLGDVVGNFFTGNADYDRQVNYLNLQNAFNASEAQKSRDFNALEAQKNRDYQFEMSNTAYQRASADMQAAGFNPALMFSQGGASSPSGSSASSASAHSGGGSTPGVNGVKNALGVASSIANIALSAYTASTNTALRQAYLELNQNSFEYQLRRKHYGY